MPCTRRAVLSAIPTVAGLSALASAQSGSGRVDPDPLGVRGDFPVANSALFLNSAYIAPTPLPVMQAGREFADAKGTAPIVLGDMLKRTDEVRAQYARLINASPDEIAFLSATSEGENVVAGSMALGRGDNVVIDELHYESEFVLYSELAKSTGVELRIAKAVGGAVTIAELEPLVNRRTKLVSVAWVSHQNGFRHDMRPIAELAHAHGAFFYTDGIQAVGMFPVDVKAAGVDAMAIGTYKWVLGTYGVAPFYVRRDALSRLRLDRYGWRNAEKQLGPTEFQIYATAKRFDYATPAFGPIYQLGAGLLVRRARRRVAHRSTHRRPGAPVAARTPHAGLRCGDARRQPVVDCRLPHHQTTGRGGAASGGRQCPGQRARERHPDPGVARALQYGRGHRSLPHGGGRPEIERPSHSSRRPSHRRLDDTPARLQSSSLTWRSR